MLVTPYLWMAVRIFSGSTFAGRVGSISGMTALMPSAGSKRANSGKVGRSTSPGSIPYVFLSSSTWARKFPCV